VKDIKLNLGCCSFKLPDFFNIDIDPSFKPDICLDLKNLDTAFEQNSVDFIFAGHIFEHFNIDDSLLVMRHCKNILKPFRMMMVVVPDYTKCLDLPIEKAEDIIMAKGDHKMLYNSIRLSSMLKQVGFTNVIPIQDLKEVPFLVVPDVNNPIPEKWQTAFLSFSLF